MKDCEQTVEIWYSSSDTSADTICTLSNFPDRIIIFTHCRQNSQTLSADKDTRARRRHPMLHVCIIIIVVVVVVVVVQLGGDTLACVLIPNNMLFVASFDKQWLWLSY